MSNLFTRVPVAPSAIRLHPADRTTVLGSCFADAVGSRMAEGGLEVCTNPFGTLYNPASILSAVRRLDSGEPFTEADCVQMGAGALSAEGTPLICSFSHHTTFARGSRTEFLRNANASLEEASAFWKRSGKVILTLGTAFVWRRADTLEAVSNCLKRPTREFVRQMLGVEECAGLLREILDSHPDKEFILTVSPIRHLGGTQSSVRGNTLSKATLQIAVSRVEDHPHVYCFPAYEILLDELRDYRFYAEDLCHPSKVAEEIIWERFMEAVTDPQDRAGVAAARKAFRDSGHRPIL